VLLPISQKPFIRRACPLPPAKAVGIDCFAVKRGITPQKPRLKSAGDSFCLRHQANNQSFAHRQTGKYPDCLTTAKAVVFVRRRRLMPPARLIIRLNPKSQLPIINCQLPNRPKTPYRHVNPNPVNCQTPFHSLAVPDLARFRGRSRTGFR